jgi:hypothetical protein
MKWAVRSRLYFGRDIVILNSQLFFVSASEQSLKTRATRISDAYV